MKFEKHSYPILILETHLDSFGHVNNATYLQIFEEARWALITERGFGYKKIHETQIGPTVLEVTLRFHKEVRLRQNMVIETQVLKYDGKVGELTQELRDESGALYCFAKFIFGFFDMRARKLISPTEDCLAAVGGVD